MARQQIDLTVAPYKVARDTFVIPQLEMAPPVGYFYFNSLVIKAREPVIVDTGAPVFRTQWLKEMANIVEPKDVRWIFLTHDDRDHSGNVMQTLEACPNATLLMTWFMVGRMAEEFPLPMDRIRFLNDGESFSAGDRTLHALRPPLFDNPTTRGLFDDRTGVYWSVDCFSSPVQHAAERSTDLPDEEWRDGMAFTSKLISPWHVLVDERKFGIMVDRVQSLPIKALAMCHGPAIEGERRVEDAFSVIRRVPEMEPWPEYYTHTQFEELMASVSVPRGRRAGVSAKA